MTATKDERPQWDNKIQFLLTSIGFAVGLGNVWRFPYQLQSNGGGAFLIPYFIMLVFEGIPLLYVELTVGQMLRNGSMGAWIKINPYMKGVGLCSLFVSLLVGMYYNTIIAWSLWYLCNSFQNKTMLGYYAFANYNICSTVIYIIRIVRKGIIPISATQQEPLPWQSCPVNTNRTGYVAECQLSSSPQYFWFRETLNISPNIETGGSLQPHLLATLILAWLIVALCLIKGIASSGKVVYFTATFPYVVLICFLVRGLTLPGASTGLSYLFDPKIEVLSDPQIWLAASTQIFFSLSLAFGGMIAFSSYNPKDSDVEVDTLIISLVNSATSLLASVVIFSILGFRATVDYEECVNENIQLVLDQIDFPEGSITVSNYFEFIQNDRIRPQLEPIFSQLQNCSVERNLDEAAAGTGLTFIVFADAILEMPGSPFWAVLFFLMLLTLGLDSMFGNVEGVLTPLGDLGLLKKIRNEFAVIGIIIFSFLVSLTFIQQSGSYWLDVFDTFAGSVPLLIIAFFELISVAWIYRYKRYERDLSNILVERNNWFRKALRGFWWITVPIISPLLLFAVFVYFLYDIASRPLLYDAWKADKGDSDRELYPGWVTAICVIITLLCTIWIPLGAALHFFFKWPNVDKWRDSDESQTDEFMDFNTNAAPKYIKKKDDEEKETRFTKKTGEVNHAFK